MQSFSKTVTGIEFNFQGFLEGQDEVCRVSVEGQSFKMIVNEHGKWAIWQQVPAWIKRLESQLAEVIETAYC